MIGDTQVTLAFDTCTDELVVALGCGEELLAHAHGSERAQQVLALVLDVCSDAEVALEEVERIAVGVGPGSFTGTRVGVSTARGLAAALNIPLAALSTLAVVAHPAAKMGETAWASINAGRSERFVQSFRWISGIAGFTMVAESTLHVVTDAKFADLVGDVTVASDKILPEALLAVAVNATFGSVDDVVPLYGREPDAKPMDLTVGRT